MYKNASSNQQSRAERGRFFDQSIGEESLTVDERIELLRNGMKILQQRMDASRGTTERKKSGREIFRMQNELSKLTPLSGKIQRAKNLMGAGFAQMFVDVAKSILSKSQYELIRNAATTELLRLKETSASKNGGE